MQSRSSVARSRPVPGPDLRLHAIRARLASLPDPEIDPRFMLALERRLLAESMAPVPHLRLVTDAPAATAHRAVVRPLPRRRGLRRSLATIAGAAAVAAAIVLVANASSLSPPVEHAMPAVRPDRHAVVTPQVDRVAPERSHVTPAPARDVPSQSRAARPAPPPQTDIDDPVEPHRPPILVDASPQLSYVRGPIEVVSR